MRENENGRANDLVMFKSTKIFSAECWFSPYLSCFLFPSLLEFSASNQAGQGYEDYQMQQLLPQTELIARQNALWLNFCQGQRDSQFWEQKCPVKKKGLSQREQKCPVKKKRFESATVPESIPQRIHPSFSHKQTQFI